MDIKDCDVSTECRELSTRSLFEEGLAKGSYRGFFLALGVLGMRGFLVRGGGGDSGGLAASFWGV